MQMLQSPHLYRYGNGGLGVGLKAIFVKIVQEGGKYLILIVRNKQENTISLPQSTPVWRPALDMLVRVKKRYLVFRNRVCFLL